MGKVMNLLKPYLFGVQWHLTVTAVGFFITAAISWSIVHITLDNPEILNFLPNAVFRYIEALICQIQIFIFSWSFVVILLERWHAKRCFSSNHGFFLSDLQQFYIFNDNKINGKLVGEEPVALLDYLSLEFTQDQRRRTALLQLAIWALPVLGFIGTVQGITEAIIGLEKNIINADGSAARTGVGFSGMAEVMGGMKYAFDTTMVGLLLMIPLVVISALFRVELEAMYTKIQQHIMRLWGGFSISVNDPDILSRDEDGVSEIRQADSDQPCSAGQRDERV
jgi:hypothetical protein